MRPLLLPALLGLAFAPSLTAQPAHALATAREVERIAETRTFWPGFDPLAIPLAIYDGKSTWLFRHPAPPGDFAPSSISSIGSHVREGRHPAVTSNSSAEIGGVMTATLIADGARASIPARQLAATAIHEAYHVFRHKQHPHWRANEADLLLYPIDDGNLLALRRLETEALRRALAATDTFRTACLARVAVDSRRERYAKMDSAFAAYERGTELNEGLASYLELLALGVTTVEIPPSGFAAADVRRRSYTIGPAIAFVLDRLRPGWQASLEAHDRQRLDEVLAGALVGAVPSPNGGCALPAADVAHITRVAQRDAAAVATSTVTRRKAFDARTGWRVILIAADGEPIRAERFDPLNVQRVDGGLLHTRFLRLGNDNCKATVIDEGGVDVEALTEGLGPHPLFSGVRRAVIAGLGKPAVTVHGEGLTVTTTGLQLECSRAKVGQREGEITISVSPTPTLKALSLARHDS